MPLLHLVQSIETPCYMAYLIMTAITFSKFRTVQLASLNLNPVYESIGNNIIYLLSWYMCLDISILHIYLYLLIYYLMRIRVHKVSFINLYQVNRIYSTTMYSSIKNQIEITYKLL